MTFLQILAFKAKKKKNQQNSLLPCERQAAGWNTLQRTKSCFKGCWAPTCDSCSATLKICFWDAWVDLYPRNENHFVIWVFGPFCPCFICNLLKAIIVEKLIERLFSTISVGNITTIEKTTESENHWGDSVIFPLWWFSPLFCLSTESEHSDPHKPHMLFLQWVLSSPVCSHCSFQLPCRGFLPSHCLILFEEFMSVLRDVLGNQQDAKDSQYHVNQT